VTPSTTHPCQDLSLKGNRLGAANAALIARGLTERRGGRAGARLSAGVGTEEVWASFAR
jgi:hypothetical protein